MRRLSPFLLLVFLLAACGKDEPTVADSALQNRSRITTPGSPATKSPTATSTDANPIPRPVATATETEVDPGIPPVNPALSDEDLINAALEKANAIRIENSSPELELDPKLAAAAQAHANDMRARKFYDHKNPDGKTPVDRVKAAGANYRVIAENIHRGLNDVDKVFEGWMKSEPHKKSLLEKQYSKHGIGYKDGYWVHVLAN